MGRRKEPSALKRLRGADQRYINDEQPQFPAPTSIRAPAVLGPVGKKHWRELAPLLIQHDLLTTADLALFTQLCVAFEIATEARQTMNDEGLFRLDEEGVQRKHPGMQVWRDATATYARLANEFGLSPAAREALGVGDRNQVDPYQEYVRRKHEADERTN